MGNGWDLGAWEGVEMRNDESRVEGRGERVGLKGTQRVLKRVPDLELFPGSASLLPIVNVRNIQTSKNIFKNLFESN